MRTNIHPKLSIGTLAERPVFGTAGLPLGYVYISIDEPDGYVEYVFDPLNGWHRIPQNASHDTVGGWVSSFTAITPIDIALNMFGDLSLWTSWVAYRPGSVTGISVLLTGIPKGEDLTVTLYHAPKGSLTPAPIPGATITLPYSGPIVTASKGISFPAGTIGLFDEGDLIQAFYRNGPGWDGENLAISVFAEVSS